jgi:hypothetical protein
MSTAVSDDQKQIKFYQFDIPPLRTGVYTLTATETVPGQTPGSFPANASFVVQGERFAIAASELQGVFPPALANGEFDGVLPHVVFARRTLPWERSLKNGDKAYERHPWLAVLLFDDATAPIPAKVKAKCLVPEGTEITVTESDVTCTGTLPACILSYGAATLVPMGYGEKPGDDCLVIDIPVATFSQIAPAASDLLYLAHIREVDISEGVDATASHVQYAVVVGNRIPAVNVPSRAFLVSLENMADYLPAEDGTPSPSIPKDTKLVRLLVYTSWAFTANNLDQNLLKILEGLNSFPAGSPSTLRMPIVGAAPDATRVQQAAANQAAASQGKVTLSSDDANVIVQNALAMGYVPLNHHLRHGGKTVSWYRGPLVPYPVSTTITVPIGGPDAANRYDPQAGLFDVSYGAAWQLGQLLALQNSAVASAIYNWKQRVRQQQAADAEQQLIKQLLANEPILESFMATRDARLADGPPAPPPGIPEWFGDLATLHGVPFNYLVPHEGMLPPESLRFFYLDFNWIDALIDGAFSIGRATTGEEADAGHLPAVRAAARTTMGRRRALAARAAGAAAGSTNPTGQVTGFLFRSQAVSGWPNLRFKGYSDAAGTALVPTLRLVNLARDTLLCLFDGVIVLLQIEEPPEQLHMGVEGKDGTYWTTLREVNAPNQGKQYGTDPKQPPTACDPAAANPVVFVNFRDDGRTLRVSDAATALQSCLAGSFGQTFDQGFTSAEFALELNKGVLMVEFKNTASQGGAP